MCGFVICERRSNNLTLTQLPQVKIAFLIGFDVLLVIIAIVIYDENMGNG